MIKIPVGLLSPPEINLHFIIARVSVKSQTGLLFAWRKTNEWE
jgi:hypothetical protein